jgi:hypothetical protein
MKLSHLLLVIALECVLVWPLASLLGWIGLDLSFETRVWICFVPAMLVALAIAWPVARVLGMPPLMIFSGPCPGCGRRPAGWWQVRSDAAQLHLVCGECGERVALWLTSAPASPVLPAVPTYALRWPRILGLWRRS